MNVYFTLSDFRLWIEWQWSSITVLQKDVSQITKTSAFYNPKILHP
ncbi:MAG: hypothetical protein ACKOW8_03470 [Flavobacteriales bacterium]